jgi:poly(A) polymerase
MGSMHDDAPNGRRSGKTGLQQLLFRYGTATDGTIRKKAHIYTPDEHGLSPRLVDSDALGVVRRLRAGGFQAYIVGGAVRDMMVGRTPNDFDIATNAHPQQIKKLFRSARIIGRRFRLVHVYCSREKYIEVTTFRSRGAAGMAEDAEAREKNNQFGTMEEDAERRDFTINALYYCPIDEQLIDYVGGYTDIRQRKLKTLIPADRSFAEDPVRMIRALKYASLLGFSIPAAMAGLVKRMREEILSCSRERVTEEVFKILTSGSATAIFDLFNRLRLFETVFPALAASLRETRKKLSEHPIAARLRELDERARDGKLLERNDMFGFLFRDLALGQKDLLDAEDADLALQQFLRGVSEPLFPSKKDLAAAAESILKEARPHRARSTDTAAARHGGEGRGDGTGPGGRRRRRRGGRRRRRGPVATKGPADQH